MSKEFAGWMKDRFGDKITVTRFNKNTEIEFADYQHRIKMVLNKQQVDELINLLAAAREG